VRGKKARLVLRLIWRRLPRAAWFVSRGEDQTTFRLPHGRILFRRGHTQLSFGRVFALPLSSFALL